MNQDDTHRIVIARSLMWDHATSDEQAEWLRAADQTLSSLARAAMRPVQPPSEYEGNTDTGHTAHDERKLA